MSLHMTRSLRPPPSIFVYCKQSKTAAGNGLGMRLQVVIWFTQKIVPTGCQHESQVKEESMCRVR